MDPAGCRNSSPPPATPQGCRSWRSGLYFCSPFPPSHSLRTRTAGGGLGGQRIRPGISAVSWGSKWAGETWLHSLLILHPPNGPPIFPSDVGSLLLPQPPLRDTSSVWPPLLLPLHSPHAPQPTCSLGVPPIPLGVYGPPQVPGRCPSCAETRIPRSPSLPS